MQILRSTLFVLASFSSCYIHAQTLIKENFGVVGHLDWVPLDKMDGIKVVRAYANASFFCQTPEEYMFQPTWQNYDYDEYLEDAKSRGMKFVICVTRNFSFYASNGSTGNLDHPVPPGADKEDPASYILYAKLVFQIAARYGTKTVPDSLLKVKYYPSNHYKHQTKRSGTDLIYGIEIWNEEDKWGGNFTPEQYYALLSACYDGHKGTLGIDVGVKQADPDLNFLFGGTNDHTPAYTAAVKTVWEQRRGEPFPEDIIYNFHGYFHNRDFNNGNRTQGVAAEMGGVLSRFQAWADFAGNHKFARTEYGYDTNPASIQDAPILNKPDSGTYSIYESQAALLLRDYHLESTFPQLLLSTFYQVRDENTGSSLQYSNSGVLFDSGMGYAQKESYFIISGFIELSDGFYSNATLLKHDPYVVQYTNQQGKYLYALWSYSKDKDQLSVTVNDDSVSMVTASKNGNIHNMLVPVNNILNVETGQMPFYIITDNPASFGLPVCQSPTSNLSICSGDSVLIYGQYRKISGTYKDTLAGHNCDSILVTNLSVFNNSVVTKNVSICEGESYYAAGDSQTESGTYYDTVAVGNCHDVTVTQLSVNACTVSIMGYVRTENNTPVKGVTMILSGTESDTFVTYSTGFYRFDVSVDGDYVVTPSKSNDSLNGISTLDVIMIQRHILSIEELNSPYKIMAAALVNSETDTSITTLDIIRIRQLILHTINTFPGGRLWAFVRSNYSFPNPQSPFPFDKSRTYSNIQQSYYNQNFIGVKLGDADGNWAP